MPLISSNLDYPVYCSDKILTEAKPATKFLTNFKALSLVGPGSGDSDQIQVSPA